MRVVLNISEKDYNFCKKFVNFLDTADKIDMFKDFGSLMRIAIVNAVEEGRVIPDNCEHLVDADAELERIDKAIKDGMEINKAVADMYRNWVRNAPSVISKPKIKTLEEIQNEMEFGDIYTTEEFKKYADDFMECDGVGYYHDGQKETRISVWDSSEIDMSYPYVCWYNKQKGKQKKIALYCLKASSDYHSEVCEECTNYSICDHTMQDDITETIIKALEQQPVFNKIRAEIEASKWTNKDMRTERNALAGGLDKALEIIDKYRTESEVEY